MRVGNSAWGHGYHSGHADGLVKGLVVAGGVLVAGVLSSAPVAPRLKAGVNRLLRRNPTAAQTSETADDISSVEGGAVPPEA